MADVALINFPRPYVGILKNALEDFLEPTEVDLDAFPNGESQFKVIAMRWEGTQPEDTLNFKRIEKIAADRKLPVVLVVEKPEAEVAREVTGLPSDRFLYPPLSPPVIRNFFQNILYPKKKGATIDVHLINPFVESTIEVLQTMAKVASRRKELFVKENYQTVGDISGVIGILGDQIEGSIAITFSQSLAETIVASMLGLKAEDLTNNTVCDGIGEVVNMVVGKAKVLLASKGYKFEIALPTVIQGKGHQVGHSQGTPCLVIVFATEEGEEFAVQVAVENVV